MADLDLDKLFQQAQLVQEQLRRAQEQLARQQVTGQSGGGMVTVTADGTGAVLRVQIDPAVVTRDDVGMLEDLVTSAVNAALHKAQALQQEAAAPLAGFQDLLPGAPR
jgi:DNA-binding YbaB/EbfC family protein